MSNNIGSDMKSPDLPSSTDKTWKRRLSKAKVAHRPKLKNWKKDGFASAALRENDFLSLQNAFSQVRDINPTKGYLKKPNSTLNDDELAAAIKASYEEKYIDRVDCRKLSVECFMDQFELIEKPCIISGIPQRDNWLAQENWNFKNKNFFHRIRRRMFKVGEDDDGYKVKVAMKYFIKYLNNNDDDSPLYIFDSNYDEDDVSKCILEDYKVPDYFSDDLFSAVGEEKRPPYRWFLLGPQRSGTTLHIDPLGTSAWNTVLQGRKRWVLFPPGTKKSIAKGLDVILKGQDDEAINYFVDILPKIKEKHGHNTNIIEFTQGPNDTVYVPGGWWHAVLNLDDTIAITQNYCSRLNFHHVWRKTRTGRKKMCIKWLNKLYATHPKLVDQALEIDRQDNFTLQYGSYLKVGNRSQEESMKPVASSCSASSNNYDSNLDDAMESTEKKSKSKSKSRNNDEDGNKKSSKRRKMT